LRATIPQAEFRDSDRRGQVRILLLEDDAAFAELIGRRLEALGWCDLSLERVQTLRDALARLEDGRVDLVLADLNLPDSNGIETLESLTRAGDRLIIVLTGAHDPALHDAAIARGAYDLVNKDQLDRVGLERLVRLAAIQASTFRSLRDTLEHIDQGISMVDAELRVVAWNRRFLELLDFPESLFNERTTFEDVIRFNARRGEYGPGDVEEQVKRRVELARRFEPHVFERTRPDGTILEIRGKPLPGGGFVTTYTDVTARRRNEQAQRESEARFRSLTELSSDWYWEQDQELRFTVITTEVQPQAKGVAASSIGKRRWEIPGLAPLNTTWEEHRTCLEARKPFRDLEFSRVLDDGSVGYVSVSGTPIFDPQGNFSGYRGVGRDITAQKRAEHLLRLEHSVTRGFAETPNAAEALKAALRAICEAGQWECGRYLWVDSAAGVLRHGEAWGVPSPNIERYLEDSRGMVYAPGHGLVGTVWVSQQPLWIPDMISEPRVARPGITRALGLRAALVVPVTGEGKPIGVLIFHSRQVREPDARLMETVRTIGSQIGQYMKRAQAEQAVRESEARFRSLTDLSSDWYWEQDADFRFTQFSGPGAGANARGGDPSIYLGKVRWEIPDLEPLEGDWSAHRAQLERHEPFRDALFRRRMEDGSSRYMSVSGEPIFDPEGSFRGYRGVARDITARTRAEEETRKTAAELRLVADNVPAMIAYHDRKLRYRYVNRRYAAFYGVPAERMIGRSIAQNIGEDVWREVRAHFEKALAGEGVSFDRRERRGDGSLRDISVDLVPHRDASGQVLGIYGLVLDVTRRRRAEKALRLRNRALEASVNSIMITEQTDKGQRLVYVNPAFERMTGYSAAEVLGRNPRFLYGGERNQPGVEALRTAGREQREMTALVRNYRKDGTPFWNELHVAPVRDESGRVTHFVGVGTDVTDRIRYQEEVERQANYDALTGLPNRNLLNDRLAQAVAKAARTGRPLGVMFVDLDHLKRINDSLGHAIGDQVIAAAGMRIAEALRTGDTVARVSGDEFVIVLTDLKRTDDAARIAAKVQERIGAPLEIESHEFVLSASIGIALHPKDGADAADLLKNADAALYRAKEEGRGCFRFFAPDMNERVLRYLRIERALRAALEAGEFRLQYQPIVRLATGEPVGAEALIRWRRADGGTVSPAEFIPIAEESGLIVPIGRWALEAAARQARQWNRGRRSPFYVTVNLSARQFRDPGLLDSIRAAFQSARVKPSLIKLEITESTVMQNPEEAVKTLRSLKDLGVRVVVDDFGTGYSSLAYLKRFPIDTLKIDRSFVRGLPEDAEDLALSRAVIDLARGLGLEVIAEGVETRRQASVLVEKQCGFAQGYFFGRPQDADALSLRGPRKRPAAHRKAGKRPVAGVRGASARRAR
jgi:diguanylate cyclase (GGDEF)-like protein/PAS domain S-box-containing protein